MQDKMKEVAAKQARFGRIAIIIAIVVAVAIALVTFFVLRGKEETITIGAILSLSGSGGDMGDETREGMLLAIEEVNSRGGVNGKKIELIVEDSETNPERGEEAFNRIEEAHHPLLYV